MCGSGLWILHRVLFVVTRFAARLAAWRSGHSAIGSGRRLFTSPRGSDLFSIPACFKETTKPSKRGRTWLSARFWSVPGKEPSAMAFTDESCPNAAKLAGCLPRKISTSLGSGNEPFSVAMACASMRTALVTHPRSPNLCRQIRAGPQGAFVTCSRTDCLFAK